MARSADAFSNAFLSVLRGEVDLGLIARRGREAAWRDFHLDAILPRIEALFQAAANDRRPPSGTPGDAYRLARMAEHLTGVMIEESLAVHA